MISFDTADHFFKKFSKDCEKDEQHITKMMSEFVVGEPNFVVLLQMMGVVLDDSNPTTAAMIAVCLYEKMRSSQESSDDIRRCIEE